MATPQTMSLNPSKQATWPTFSMAGAAWSGAANPRITAQQRPRETFMGVLLNKDTRMPIRCNGSVVLHRFKDCRDSLSRANAHRRQSKSGLTPPHRVNERRRNARPACAQRVTDGDGAAVHVHLFRVGLE